MIASFVTAWFTKAALAGAAGKLWKGFCDFIATPIGAALVAGLLMYNVGVIKTRTKVNAAWQQKWAEAEAEAERARLRRDGEMKIKIAAAVDSRLAVVEQRKAELEEKVRAYEDEEAKQLATGNLDKTRCSPFTDSSDERWLSEARRAAKPQARRGLAERLRALGR